MLKFIFFAIVFFLVIRVVVRVLRYVMRVLKYVVCLLRCLVRSFYGESTLSKPPHTSRSSRACCMRVTSFARRGRRSMSSLTTQKSECPCMHMAMEFEERCCSSLVLSTECSFTRRGRVGRRCAFSKSTGTRTSAALRFLATRWLSPCPRSER